MISISIYGNFDSICDIIKSITNDVIIYNIENTKVDYSDIVIISKYTKKIPKCRFIISEYINIPDFPYESYIVTCGTDSKATITVSSFTDVLYSNIQCCIQRTIYTLKGNEIDEQEFSVKSCYKNINVLLISIAAALINDIDINIIKKRLLKSINAE